MTDEAMTQRFGARTAALEVVAGQDLHGREAIVTGGASGIGVETVRALAAAGARVVLAARNMAAAETVAAALRSETPGAVIETAALDLASLASVRSFVARYVGSGRALQMLVNNAGVMATPQSRTTDGFEMQFGTNHLGHFALATGLLPALRAGARAGAGNARVVALSSSGHRLSDIHFEDLNYRERAYDPFQAYGQSKTANALFAVEWTRRYAGEGITANAVMPGGIMTGLQKHMPREMMIAAGWIDAEGKQHERFKSPAQGAATSVWAAVAPELEGRGGLYLEDCGIAGPWSDERMHGVKPYALDGASARRLWEASEELVGG